VLRELSLPAELLFVLVARQVLAPKLAQLSAVQVEQLSAPSSEQLLARRVGPVSEQQAE
jgi:hypothetical protein